MTRRGRTATCAVTLLLFSLLAFGCSNRGPRVGAPSPPRPRAQVTDLSKFTTGDYEGCPPEGSGGDPDLNRLKNRDLPPPAYEPIAIPDLLANQSPALLEAGRKERASWPRTALAQAIQWESRGVSVEGYLLRVKQEGPESCNCSDKTKREYHIWVGDSPDADRAQSVVVEVSPRLLPSHPNWRVRILSRLAKDHAKVRISGWLMWDQEHPEQIGKTRGTLWEVHPIHVIEVWSGGQWRSLDG
jgi:hypothetical protein